MATLITSSRCHHIISQMPTPAYHQMASLVPNHRCHNIINQMSVPAYHQINSIPKSRMSSHRQPVVSFCISSDNNSIPNHRCHNIVSQIPAPVYHQMTTLAPNHRCHHIISQMSTPACTSSDGNSCPEQRMSSHHHSNVNSSLSSYIHITVSAPVINSTTCIIC